MARVTAGPDQRKTGHAALTLVVLALLLLGLLPAIEQQRIARRLDRVSTVIDPARSALSDMQVGLALEAAGTRGFLLNGDPRYAESHRQARARRKRAYARLESLVASLEPEVQAQVTQLGTELAAADVLLDGLYGGSISRQHYLTYLPAQQARFVTITSGTADLHYRMRARASFALEQIREFHRVGSAVSLAGALLGLAAVIAVARLSAHNRALADRERLARVAMEKAREEAERRRAEGERLGASRAGLMRGFSHDVRNALGAANTYLYMLERGTMGALSEAQDQGLRKARQSISGAVELIDDLLEFARAEAGEIALQWSTLDLRQIVTRIVDEYRGQAEAKGLALSSEVPPAFPPIESDARRVDQILGNLVGNAIKYTRAGSVRVRLHERRDAGQSDAAVEVEDTGPGIREEDQSSIFEEFYRLRGTEPGGGSGIGLAISRRVAAALGGRISVASVPGRGSTFSLWLPLEADAAARPQPTSQEKDG